MELQAGADPKCCCGGIYKNIRSVEIKKMEKNTYSYARIHGGGGYMGDPTHSVKEYM